MPLWMRTMIMLGTFAAWGVYVTLIFLHGSYPPIAAWSVPGISYALLSGRVIRFNKSGVSVDEEKQTPPRHRREDQ